LIGLEANVVKSTHPSYVGIRGRIVDETKNTIVILDDDRKKRVQKSVVVLHLRLPEGSVVEVDGKQIMGRPVSRVKKKARR
jgi:ribonuclease P protein subunit POP4